MSTTRYVTGTADGVLTLTARALDPEGNPITTKFVITVSPNPAQAARPVQVCYSQIILVSTPQNTLEAACAQFGTALTYYVGAPSNTIYSTMDCSTIAQDGYYKLEDGSWILVRGGRIAQRGNCATVGVTTDTNSTAVTTIPEFTQPVLIPATTPTPVSTTVEPIVIEQPVIIPAPTTIPTQPTQIDVPGVAGPITVFVPTVTFTPPAPTLAPPPTTVTTVQPIIIEQPVLIPATPTTTTTTFTPTPQPTFVPAQAPAPQPVFGCTDRNAINYNPNATNDDGTCQYQTFSGGGFFDTENLNVI